MPVIVESEAGSTQWAVTTGNVVYIVDYRIAVNVVVKFASVAWGVVAMPSHIGIFAPGVVTIRVKGPITFKQDMMRSEPVATICPGFDPRAPAIITEPHIKVVVGD